MSQDNAVPRSALLLDYLRLVRLPNVFTALADVTMGFVFVQRQLAPAAVFACLAVASALLYISGMILNDVFDADVDAVERPERPIPAGRISRALARRFGFSLLVAGVAVGGLAGWFQPPEQPQVWRSGAVAGALALNIVVYDGVLKVTLVGPVCMGLCRFLNVLLGMSVAGSCIGGFPYEGWTVLGYGVPHLIAAGGIGLYVVGLTWFSRQEAAQSRRGPLALGFAIMVAGLGVLGLLHRSLPEELPKGLESQAFWFLLLGMLAVTILRRCVAALYNPGPEQVQAAVKHGIQSLIVLNAAVAVEVSSLEYAIGLLLLLIPSTVLGKWVYST